MLSVAWGEVVLISFLWPCVAFHKAMSILAFSHGFYDFPYSCQLTSGEPSWVLENWPTPF